MCKNRFHAVTSIFLAICVFLSMVFSVSASSNDIQPNYLNISRFVASLQVSDSGYSECSCSATAYDPLLILDIKMELQQYKSGAWEQTEQWSTSGQRKVTLNKNKYVTHGYSYRVYATVTVKNSSGTILEKPSAVSETIYY